MGLITSSCNQYPGANKHMLSTNAGDFLLPNDLLPLLQPGDLIEFQDGIIRHWAIYAGHTPCEEKYDPLIFHFFKFGDDSHRVRLDGLCMIAAGRRCRKNNLFDHRYPVKSSREILETATAKLGQGGYRMITNNCQHFVNECRYGKPESPQVSYILRSPHIWLKVLLEVIQDQTAHNSSLSNSNLSH